MKPAPDPHLTYYEAMRSRDARFDGKFFVGVKTTGVYCRPICPARPKPENVEFFKNHLAAERAGYRPCLRCRPESAPQSPVWIGKSAIVRRAIKILNNPESHVFDENRFAALFGVTARHLRRVFIEEVGKTPKQLSVENRLNLARKLLVETSLPITEIVFAAGFGSIRRFNEAFRDRFSRSPSQIRRRPQTPGAPLRLSLSYRPPFNFEGQLRFYRSHAVGRLERFEDGKMFRIIEGTVANQLSGTPRGVLPAGEITISNDPARSCLIVEFDARDAALLMPGIQSILARVRALFDLDSDPVVVANKLESDPALKRLLRKHPGVRLPSGWDGFEVAVSAILGQLVSVARGRSLVADLIELTGEDSGRRTYDGHPIRYFPTPAKLAAADLGLLKTTGVRKRALQAFAQRVSDGTLSLALTQDVDQFVKQILEINGIGPWTASYMALKVLRHADAFPQTDLVIKQAVARPEHPPAHVDRMSPWRGYVATLFWLEYPVRPRDSAVAPSTQRGKRP